MAAVADRDAGYEGTVNTAEWARLVSAGMGARFSVLSHAGATAGAVAAESSLAVTQGTGDRGLRVEAGRAVGDGVLSEFDTATALQGTAVASGSRWDTVVARRDWQTSTTTLMVLDGGTTKALSVNVQSDRGSTVSDQPLALVRFAAASTVVQEIVDLRTWVGAGGGLLATSTDSLQYLADVGTHVTVGRETWVRGLDAVGSPAWVNSSPSIDLGLTPSSGWSPALNYGPARIHRNGNLVTVTAVLSRSSTAATIQTIGAGTQVATAPAGFDPTGVSDDKVMGFAYLDGALGETIYSQSTRTVRVRAIGSSVTINPPTGRVIVDVSWTTGEPFPS